PSLAPAPSDLAGDPSETAGACRMARASHGHPGAAVNFAATWPRQEPYGIMATRCPRAGRILTGGALGMATGALGGRPREQRRTMGERLAGLYGGRILNRARGLVGGRPQVARRRRTIEVDDDK